MANLTHEPKQSGQCRDGMDIVLVHSLLFVVIAMHIVLGNTLW